MLILQGRSLGIPEKVPFRLTQDIIGLSEANYFIIKPFEPDFLFAQMALALQRQQAYSRDAASIRYESYEITRIW